MKTSLSYKSVLLILCLLSFGQQVFAAATPATPQLTITGVEVDFDNGKLLVAGQNFDKGAPPTAVLGQYSLAVTEFSGSHVIATLPANLAAGDYLLVIKTGNSVVSQDTYALTVGGVGPTGPQGPRGPRGSTGPRGPMGPTGLRGPMGPTGLRGPMGPSGTQGPQGPAGMDGKTVLSGTGVPGAIGVEGDFYIDTAANTIYGPKSGGVWGQAVSLVGPQGVKGDKGDPGPQGIQGLEGPKGDTGAMGPAGPQGPKGDTGAMGPAGPQGPKGDTGATGPAGPQGPIGPSGPRGPQGLAGPGGKTVLSGSGVPGEIGVEGDFYIDTAANMIYGPKSGGMWGKAVSLVGPQGVKGDPGPQGIKGDTGSQGPAGPPGPAGEIPRMTSDQRNALSAPAEGMAIYNTTEHRLEYWNGTQWRAIN